MSWCEDLRTSGAAGVSKHHKCVSAHHFMAQRCSLWPDADYNAAQQWALSEHVQTARAPAAARDALSRAMYMYCRSDFGLDACRYTGAAPAKEASSCSF